MRSVVLVRVLECYRSILLGAEYDVAISFGEKIAYWCYLLGGDNVSDN